MILHRKRNLIYESKLFYKWGSKLGYSYMNKAIDRLLEENKIFSKPFESWNQEELFDKLDKYFELEFQLRQDLSPEKGKSNLQIIKEYKQEQKKIFK